MTTASISITADDLVQRARDLRDLIKSEAAESEALGHYTPAVHEAFRAAGFYDLLTPKAYGGLQVDLSTFARVLIEVGRGDPGTAWCLCLGQGHALTVAASWPQQAQEELFANPTGYFRASHGLNPSGTAQRVDGGWLVNATSKYQSGSAYASHVIVSVAVVDDGPPAGMPSGGPPPGMPAGGPPPGMPAGGPPPGMPAGGPPPGMPAGGPPPGMPAGMPPRVLQVLIPAGKFRILDDWGGDATLGMRASGSNTVVVEDVVVPEYYGTEGLLDSTAESVGARLYGDPLYLGAGRLTFFQLELVVSVLGAARAAIDEYDAQARTKLTPMSAGGGPRIQSPFYQRDLASASIKTEAAEAIVAQVTSEFMRRSALAVDGAEPFTMVEDTRLGCMLMEAGELACTVVDLLFRSSGTSSAMRDQPMQRYLRDVWMYRTHQAAQIDPTLQRYGAVLLGVDQGMFR